MATKRVRLEVVYDMLNIIKNNNNSIRPTPLLRKCNLSTDRFHKYYSELLTKGFVREIETKDGKLITLTDKGFRYIEKYSVITSFIEDFGL